MRIPSILSCALVIFAWRAQAQCPPPVQKLISDQRYDDARAQAQALLVKNPSDDAGLHCMGMVFINMDKPADAIDWFEKAVAANDKSSLHHLWLANALGQQAEHTNKLKLPFLARRIKSEFDKAVELDPTSIDARHGLIQFYSQAPGVMGGSMDKAKEQAREIGKLNAMRGHIEIAELLERDKDLAGAEREFIAAVSMSPDSIGSYISLGSFYRRQKRYAEAVSTYDRLLVARPDAVAARLNVALTLVTAGQNLDRAESEVKQWLSAPPPKNGSQSNLVAAHIILGKVYQAQTKKDAARTEYEAALAINPKNEEAKKGLAAVK